MYRLVMHTLFRVRLPVSAPCLPGWFLKAASANGQRPIYANKMSLLSGATGCFVAAGGGGSEALRRAVGCRAPPMQRVRPLHGKLHQGDAMMKRSSSVTFFDMPYTCWTMRFLSSLRYALTSVRRGRNGSAPVTALKCIV